MLQNSRGTPAETIGGMIQQSELTVSLHKKQLSRQDALLVVLSVDIDSPKSVETIKSFGKAAGCSEITKWNISDILKKSKGLAIRLSDGWCLSSRGRAHVLSLDILPERKNKKVIQHASQLRTEASKLRNADTKAFVDEAIEAYEAGLYRSCVVLSWVGAVSLLYDHVMKSCLSAFNAEAKKRDPKWAIANSKDDLARMKESVFIEIIGNPPLSVIGKNLKEELKNNCLSLRNACGHPNSLKIGENKASAHLEILILNIYSPFS